MSIAIDQLKNLQSYGIADERLILTTKGSTKEQIVPEITGKHIPLLAENVQNIEILETWLKGDHHDRPPFFVSLETPSEANLVKVAKLGAIPIVATTTLTSEIEGDTTLTPVSRLLL